MSYKVMLFQKQNYEGEKLLLTAGVPKLKGTGLNKHVGSLIVIGGNWILFNGENYTGTYYSVLDNGGPESDGCYPSYNDWGASTEASASSKLIESISAGPPPNWITVTGYFIEERVECPEFQGDDGELYTIGGGLTPPPPSSTHYEIVGPLQDPSFCQRGITLILYSATPI